MLIYLYISTFIFISIFIDLNIFVLLLSYFIILAVYNKQYVIKKSGYDIAPEDLDVEFIITNYNWFTA